LRRGKLYVKNEFLQPVVGDLAFAATGNYEYEKQIVLLTLNISHSPNTVL